MSDGKCPRCGVPLEADGKFCTGCGTALAAGPVRMSFTAVIPADFKEV